MTVFKVAVADGALATLDKLADRYAGTAEFRTGDISTPAALEALTTGADALIVTLQRLTDQHLEALPESVRVIGRAGVGLDSIDLVAAARRDIPVVFQPTYATDEVADHALTLLLAAQRRVLQADERLRRDGWLGAGDLGPIGALREATAAVLGAGRIGRAVIRRLRPFVNRVLAFDLAADLTLDPAEAAVSTDLDQVLRSSQIVTLHLPLTVYTRHVIGEREIATMPAGGVLVNVSRGGLIDEDALAAALRSGHLAAAALDVFETEPLAVDSPLRHAPNLVLSPHIAWYSSQSGPRLAAWTVADVLAVLTGGEPAHGAYAKAPDASSSAAQPVA